MDTWTTVDSKSPYSSEAPKARKGTENVQRLSGYHGVGSSDPK